MCTAVGQDHLIAEANELGARATLLKPFSPEGLLEIMKSALEAED